MGSDKLDTKISVEDNSEGSFENIPERRDDGFFRRVLNKIQIQEKGNLSTAQLFLYNPDLKPIEIGRREWTHYSYIFFWIADSFNVNTFEIASTGVEAGLTVWQVFLSIVFGYSFTAIFVVMAARIGAIYHISFPVTIRASFGIFGSLWPIIQRVVMAIVWYSVQAYIAQDAVGLVLKGIFGVNVDTKVPDHIPSPNVTSFEFLCFFLFWLFSLPMLWFPPQKIRHLFTAKAVITPIAAVTLLVWTLVKAKGAGKVLSEPSKLHGNALAWAFISSLMNSLANFATLIINAPDFSRFANKPTAALWPQLFAIPLCFSITSLFGILISSASAQLTSDGSVLWNPLDVCNLLITNNTRGERAGAFFVGLSFAVAQLGTNISANSLSAGTDMTAILPRYINIRRGSYICAAIALCICPWNLMSSSTNFTTYLSAYAIFLSAIAGVVASDYYFIRRGKLRLYDLYTADPQGIYTYAKGFNWRAFVAYICGMAPNIVGFVGATGTHTVPVGATYVYDLNFFGGFITSFVVYAVLCKISPVPGRPIDKFFVKGWYEEEPYVEDFDDIRHGGLVAANHHTDKYE